MVHALTTAEKTCCLYHLESKIMNSLLAVFPVSRSMFINTSFSCPDCNQLVKSTFHIIIKIYFELIIHVDLSCNSYSDKMLLIN